jgi:hypothetical protein
MSRRILEGRKDKGKMSPGLRELGIVIIKHPKKNGVYQLTSFGLLYSIKKCHFSKNEFYQIAKNNKHIFPKIFKNTKYFERNKIPLKILETISDGKLGELNEQTISNIPYYEIMSYLRMFENEKMGQVRFGDFVSLWFYTYLLLFLSGKKSKTVSIAWRLTIIENKDTLKWYSRFLKDVITFHNYRQKILSESLVILNKDIQDPTKIEEFIEYIGTEE